MLRITRLPLSFSFLLHLCCTSIYVHGHPTALSGPVESNLEPSGGELESLDYTAKKGLELLTNNVRNVWNEINGYRKNDGNNEMKQVVTTVSTGSKSSEIPGVTIHDAESDKKDILNKTSTAMEIGGEPISHTADHTFNSEIIDGLEMSEKAMEIGVNSVSQTIGLEKEKLENAAHKAKNEITGGLEMSKTTAEIGVIEAANSVTIGEEKVEDRLNKAEEHLTSTWHNFTIWISGAWDKFCNAFHTILRVFEVAGFLVFLGFFIMMYIKVRQAQNFIGDIFTKHSTQTNVQHTNGEADTPV